MSDCQRLPRMEHEPELPSPEILAELALGEARGNALLTERLEQLRIEPLVEKLLVLKERIQADEIRDH